MYTHCPHCRTTFRIYPDQLSQARGQVRCGVCSYCFNALESLSEAPLPLPPASDEAHGHPDQFAPLEQPTPAVPLTTEEPLVTAETGSDAEQALEAQTSEETLPATDVGELEQVEETEAATNIYSPLSEHVEEPEGTEPTELAEPTALIEPAEPVEPTEWVEPIASIEQPAPTTPATPEEEPVEELETGVGTVQEFSSATDAETFSPAESEALEHLDEADVSPTGPSEEPFAIAGVPASTEEGQPPTPALEATFEAPQPGEAESEAATEQEETTAPPSTQPDNILPDIGIIAAEPRPATAVTEAAPSRVKTLLWAAVNLVLILSLVGQYAYYNRNELAQYPQLQPWLAQLCTMMACDTPLRREVSRITLTKRLVESHPTRPDALLIDATLVNRADFPQPYPLLEIRFSDLNNQLVAGRRFRPSEYMPAGTAIGRGMPPHQPVHIVLEIVDPGKDAVSFLFSLL